MDVNDSGREVNHERLDNLRRGRGPIQEHIIDEFLAGRLSRRDFLKKGTAFGLSLPLLGGILEAKGLPGREDLGRLQAARRAPRGRHDQGRHHRAGRRDQPAHDRRRRRPRAARQRRRVPRPGGPGARLPAMARHELDLQRQGERLDLQDPPGRQVQQRQPHDRRRRRLQLQDPVRPEERLERPLGVLRDSWCPTAW